MTLKFIAAVIAILALPLTAQAQNPPAKKVTKADAQKIVAIISGDKAKAQTYCDMAKLGDQIEQADQKKDSKKAEELGKKMDDMSAKLGPEYIALMDGLQNMNPDSKDGKDIAATLEALDKLCAK